MMADAVRQGPRSKKWNVISENGVIEYRGVSEIEARKLAADLTKAEITRKLEQRSRERKWKADQLLPIPIRPLDHRQFGSALHSAKLEEACKNDIFDIAVVSLSDPQYRFERTLRHLGVFI